MPGLGRIPNPDPRDHQFLLRRLLAVPTEPLPTRKTWGFRGPILDQGNTGTCEGHAWRDFLRCAPTQTKTGPSAWDIYRAAILLDPWASNDAEATLPDNDPGLDGGTDTRSPAAYLTTLGRLKSYLWAFTLADTTAWILRNGPVVFGTNWYGSMFTPDAEGIVRITPNAKVEGGHAYCGRGVDSKRGLVGPIINSWGTGWGLKGQFYVPYEDMERLIAEDGEVCTAVEQRVVAKVA